MASALLKAGRKIGRVGKDAFKFRFFTVFESIDMSCLKGWRPSSLTVRWSRGGRVVSSNPARLGEKDGSGQFQATWEPPDQQELIVTLYKESNSLSFEEKEYKFQVEDESGAGKKKVLAVFYINMAEYGSIRIESDELLSMEFKCNSVKVSSVVVTARLRCQFLKQGKSYDDDMVSTFSTVDNAADFEDDDMEDPVSLNDAQARNLEVSVDSYTSKGLVDKQQTNVKAVNGMEPDKKEYKRKKSKEAPTLLATAALPKSPSPTSPPPPLTNAEQSGNSTTVSERDLQLNIRDFFVAAHFRDTNGKLLSQADLLHIREFAVFGLFFSSRSLKTKDFIEKLKKFYETVRHKNGSFEVVFISNDKSTADMMDYVKEESMPWVSLDYEDNMCGRLRRQYNVKSHPLLVIIDSSGTELEQNGLHAIPTAVANGAEWKTFKQWHATASLPFALTNQSPSYGNKHSPSNWGSRFSPPLSPASSNEAGSMEGVADSDERQPQEMAVEQVTTVGSKDKKKDASKSPERQMPSLPENQVGNAVQASLELTQVTKKDVERKDPREQKREKDRRDKEHRDHVKKKDDLIRQLEAENSTLKGQVAELREDVIELQQQVEELRIKLNLSEASKAKLSTEKELTEARLVLKGWLMKRGIKGPTAHIWRRRWFSVDEENTCLYYYKENNDKHPQGLINLNMVEGVEEQSPDLQDKNNASFNVITKGRVFELMAIDERTMRRWIQSLETLRNWRKSSRL